MTDASPKSLRGVPPTKSRTVVVGAAFIAGTCLFAATFAVVRFLSRPRYDALRPESERTTSGLSMPTLDHHQWNLADHAGKVVLINYFATWCGPCVEETPELVKLAKDYAGKVDVVAISLDQDSDQNRPRVERLQDFAAKYQIPFPILLPSLDSPVFEQNSPIPQTMLIDRHRRAARTIIGEFDPANLRQSINELIEEN